jgi:hypothetical protein
VWILTKCWAIVSPATSAAERPPVGALQLQQVFALKIPAVLLGGLVWWGTRTDRSTWVPMLLSAMLAVLSVLMFPTAFKQSRFLGAVAATQEVADWVEAIPPTATVLVTPPSDVGAFVWFTLRRPNYLTVDQSSGVVFSRETALEVRRRSEVLLPLQDPSWKIFSAGRAQSSGRRKGRGTAPPLTSKSLIEVCADPLLGFVISPATVGFGPLHHEHAGAWKGWNLYDCGKVRSSGNTGEQTRGTSQDSFNLFSPLYAALMQRMGIIGAGTLLPESSSVLLSAAPPVFAAIPWFTLERTSYTSLTAKGLEEICQDGQLGFVVAKDDVGFSPIKHTDCGEYQNWNLYDCRRVRANSSDTL